MVWVFQCKKVQFEPCSDIFSTISHFLNPELDLRSGSAISLNFKPNLGPIQAGSGSNHSSEPKIGITRNVTMAVQSIYPVIVCKLLSERVMDGTPCSTLRTMFESLRVMAARW